MGRGEGDPLLRQGGERTHHGIVLVAGDDGVSAPVENAADGDIQGVGGVLGENDPFRGFQAKELRCQLPAGKDGLLGPEGRSVPRASRVGAGEQSPVHGPDHGGGLLQRGGRAVQIDHQTTSRQRPSSRRS